MPARVARILVWEGIKSSYQPKSAGGGTGGPRETLIPLAQIRSAAFLTPDTAQALEALSDTVQAAGGDLRVTDAFRDVSVQAEARKKYENWLNAGKPRNYDPRTMKNAFVAKPGYSFHNAGRAIDIDVKNLKFPGLPYSQQLDRFWELAAPIGWRPVIKSPDEGAMEAWHFDFMGPWAQVYDRLGYKDAAMCAAMDIGVDIYSRYRWCFVQAQLHRAGRDVGEIDGYYGSRTAAGLTAVGLTAPKKGSQPSNALLDEVMALPNAPYHG